VISFCDFPDFSLTNFFSFFSVFQKNIYRKYFQHFFPLETKKKKCRYFFGKSQTEVRYYPFMVVAMRLYRDLGGVKFHAWHRDQGMRNASISGVGKFNYYIFLVKLIPELQRTIPTISGLSLL